ncbi:translation elongation factor Ts [Calorimonas adulescens]|jgi:translation elongation factor Ts (EF-Ts)|uniref:Elongation factor Ts n=1 Tax=Calorimonas adulescens TaxID=2606906 RepID=A0A5D8QGN6_9THEO|nr:translation elongation factor Ts [Calorimonas adulescens]TZE83324.1 translation elongation factor Ts [Calorimonas adulescens]
MTITPDMVKELRERTGSGIMDCKKALQDANGNIEEAIVLLRERGLAAASKKSGRTASEGIVESYIHGEGRIGVLIEVNCETDFVARNSEFRNFVHELAMQIAAANPQYVRREDIPESVIQREREIIRAQVMNEGKPANIADKIIEGRLEKYYKENCLMEQSYIRNPDITIEDFLKEKIAKLGENIIIRRFTRYEVGEGLDSEE